jgi:cystathionine beta-lyase
MRYNFDEVIDRRGTNSTKVDGLKRVFGREDVLPLWVADMEFRTPDFIVEALRRRCEHEVFGYTFAGEEYYASITGWVQRKHGWTVQREWVTHVPGIVKGIGFVIECFTEVGDKVIIQPPVYHPFRLAPSGLGREVVYNPLREGQGGRYEMDFEHLERLLRGGGCKVLLLSSPHNPGGVVWTRETLAQLGDVCARYGVLVVSDEIHGEMVYGDHRHYPFATVSEEAREHSITFMSPSKTFNIPGIVTSYAVVPSERLRGRFYRYLNAAGFGEGSVFSYEATRAAYTEGWEWLGAMIEYVKGNVEWMTSSLERRMPDIKVYKPDASFLLWLDCRGLGLNQTELTELFVHGARLGLNDGAQFGPGGEGFMRMNVGCSRALLVEAVKRLPPSGDIHRRPA